MDFGFECCAGSEGVHARNVTRTEQVLARMFIVPSLHAGVTDSGELHEVYTWYLPI